MASEETRRNTPRRSRNSIARHAFSYQSRNISARGRYSGPWGMFELMNHIKNPGSKTPKSSPHTGPYPSLASTVTPVVLLVKAQTTPCSAVARLTLCQG